MRGGGEGGWDEKSRGVVVSIRVGWRRFFFGFFRYILYIVGYDHN